MVNVTKLFLLATAWAGAVLASNTVTDGVRTIAGELVTVAAESDLDGDGQTAENVNRYLKKGSQVFIEGRIKTRKYEKDGQTHYITELYADSIQFLDRKNAEAGSRASTHNRQPSESQQSELEDIPF